LVGARAAQRVSLSANAQQDKRQILHSVSLSIGVVRL